MLVTELQNIHRWILKLTVMTNDLNMTSLWHHVKNYCKIAFTEEDKIVIKVLEQNKNFGANSLRREFPEKG